ncbi:MAG TPA: NAD-dependent epimerase/dehydratase family protein [Thermoanaerobaculia bacterium]|nr:NAD-dependent epimerase/dehydratase family protein [Thermoanaerobaculia bacterium]
MNIETDTTDSTEKRPVLVTGGAGFIGSHVVDSFLALGHPVVVLDDLSSGDAARLPSAVRFVKGDLRDAALADLLREERVDTIFHHAAQVDVRKSVADPVFDAEVNVLGTLRLALAARQAGVRQVVFASSGGAIYGDPRAERADEDHPLDPCSPYGVAKLAGEKYLAAFAGESGYLLTVLRYANVYGPRQDGNGEAGVIGIWMNRLLSGEDATINGDGSQTRDFVHVADVVKANRAAFHQREGGVFNIGTGVETSVKELYRLVAEACGTSRPALHGPGKPGEQMRSVLDASRAARHLGLAATVPLREGLAATAEWFRMHRAQQGL